MRLAIDARAATEVPAGRGRVVRELLQALARRDDDHRYALLCRQPWTDAHLDGRFRWVRIPAPDPVWHLGAAAWASMRADALLSTNSYLTAWFTAVPTVVLVYDLVAFLDASAQARAAAIERATIGRAVRRAAALLCISAATEADLLARHPHATGRTAVMHLAADARFSRPRSDEEVRRACRRHGLEEPFGLAVGTLEPRKNLVALMDAWMALPHETRGDRPLAIVGARGWEIAEIEARVAAAAGEVRTLGYVSDDDLACLYAGCTVFAYPSLYEGFGLPVLEAMAAGAPVLTSNVSSLPEVAGDAAVLIDPRDPAALRDGLSRLLNDDAERARLHAAGPARAATFSWDRSAAELLAVMERISRAQPQRARSTRG